jgi:hypothetical protein
MDLALSQDLERQTAIDRDTDFVAQFGQHVSQQFCKTEFVLDDED